MGSFFTSTQIYAPGNHSKEQFLDMFCKEMKEEGYVICDCDESEITYILRFADNCKWVTITSEKYEQGNRLSQQDTGRIAKMLKTTCVNTILLYLTFMMKAEKKRIRLYSDVLTTTLAMIYLNRLKSCGCNF